MFSDAYVIEQQNSPPLIVLYQVTVLGVAANAGILVDAHEFILRTGQLNVVFCYSSKPCFPFTAV